MWAAICILIVLLTTSLPGRADNGFLPPPSGMVVDLHWIDVLQDDDLKSFDMTETLFFNNTGDEVFNGTVYVWIPLGAVVTASCCGGTPDMACRLEGDGQMACFTVWQMEDNIVSIAPFSESRALSFYGQTATLNLSVISQANTTNADFLPLNIEIGGSSVAAGSKNTSASGIHLISENSTVGAVQQFNTAYPPLVYDYIQKIEVYNNGYESDTFDLGMEGLPIGWEASFVSSGVNITSITIGPSERLEIGLAVNAPAHVAAAFIGYELNLGNGQNEEVVASYSKRFLYDTDAVEYYVFLLEDSTLEEGANVTMTHPPSGEDPIWNEPNGRYWYIASSIGLDAGAVSDMKISWVVQNEYLPFVLVAASAGLMISLFAVPMLRKRKAKSKGESASDDGKSKGTSPSESESGSPKESAEKVPDDAGLKSAMKRVEIDLERGLISKEQAVILTSRLRERGSADSPPGSQEDNESTAKEAEAHDNRKLSTHVAQLGTLKRIVKEIDSQHDRGELPDDIHSELRADYGAKIESLQREMESSAMLNSEQIGLTRKKEKMLKAIEKLRTDFETGKVSEDVYGKLKDSYQAKVVELDISIEEAGRD
jgi:hypothetical protein